MSKLLKHTTAILFFTLCTGFLAAGELDGISFDGFDYNFNFNNFEFASDTVTYSPPEALATIITVPYATEIIEGLTYITLGDEGSTKFLALYDDMFLVLYVSGQDSPYFIGSTVNPKSFFNSDLLPEEANPMSSGPLQWTASSYYSTASESYPPANVSSLENAHPWVEGVSGNGIGEYLILERRLLATGFIISNGYVSFNRPDLYYKNSRIKTLRITNPLSGAQQIIELEDTPNIQKIVLNKDSFFGVMNVN